ncbi:MAG: hypothetical protein ABEJ56_01505 [Candidatus Nanohaloarchaea archaeon]
MEYGGKLRIYLEILQSQGLEQMCISEDMIKVTERYINNGAFYTSSRKPSLGERENFE